MRKNEMKFDFPAPLGPINTVRDRGSKSINARIVLNPLRVIRSSRLRCVSLVHGTKGDHPPRVVASADPHTPGMTEPRFPWLRRMPSRTASNLRRGRSTCPSSLLPLAVLLAVAVFVRASGRRGARDFAMQAGRVLPHVSTGNRVTAEDRRKSFSSLARLLARRLVSWLGVTRGIAVTRGARPRSIGRRRPTHATGARRG